MTAEENTVLRSEISKAVNNLKTKKGVVVDVELINQSGDGTLGPCGDYVN